MRNRILFILILLSLSMTAYAGTASTQLDQQNIWLSMLGFYGAGLLLAFTPCVLPMVPILSGILAGQKQAGTKRALQLSLIYVLSMALTYAVAGMLAGYLGSTVQTLMQQTWIITGFSLIFVLMALSMFGLFHLSMPSFITRHVHHAHNGLASNSNISAAIMGVLATLIASPCVTAPLLSVLTYISQSGSPLRGGAILFVLALGMGTPLILFGMGQSAVLPKTGMWMEQVRKLFGVMMLALAVWMMSRILPGIAVMFLWSGLLIISAVAFGALDFHAEKRLPPVMHGASVLVLMYGVFILAGAARGNDDLFAPLSATASVNVAQSANVKRPASSLFTYIDTLPKLQQKIAAATQLGKPVMIEFFATWCPVCKHVDADVLSNEQIRASMKSFVTIRVDLSERSPELARIMESYQVLGVPTLVFFDKQGKQVKLDESREITTSYLQSILTSLA